MEMYKVFAGQGQGGVEIFKADTLQACLDLVKQMEGQASFKIVYPDSSFHKWEE